MLDILKQAIEIDSQFTYAKKYDSRSWQVIMRFIKLIDHTHKGKKEDEAFFSILTDLNSIYTELSKVR